MARPSEYENGTYDAGADASSTGGVQGARAAVDGPQVLPNVYHPGPEPSPAYDAYTDPAAAHGWQNAYDETTELPPVPADADGAGDAYRGGEADGGGGDGYDYVYEDGQDYAGRYEDGHDYAGRYDAKRGRGRRRARRKPSAWRSRRVAVAAGAVGAVSMAAVIAGFSLSGSSTSGSSSPGGAHGRDDRTSPTAEDSAAPGGPGKGPAASDGSSATDPSPTTATASASPSPSASDGPTGEPSPTPTTAGAAPATTTAPTTTTVPGSGGGKPGRGQGNTKKPG